MHGLGCISVKVFSVKKCTDAKSDPDGACHNVDRSVTAEPGGFVRQVTRPPGVDVARMSTKLIYPGLQADGVRDQSCIALPACLLRSPLRCSEFPPLAECAAS